MACTACGYHTRDLNTMKSADDAMYAHYQKPGQKYALKPGQFHPDAAWTRQSEALWCIDDEHREAIVPSQL